MTTTNNTLSTIIALWLQFGRKRHLQLVFFGLLMLLSVFAEIFSIGAVIPFIAVLTDPDTITQNAIIINIVPDVYLESPSDLMLPFTILFVSATVLAAVIRILVLWVRAGLTRAMGVQLRSLLYSKILHQPYGFHLSRNSSELISIVTEKASYAVAAGVLQVLALINSLVVVVGIVLLLILISPTIALSCSVVVGLSYFIIVSLVRKTITKNGKIITESQPLAVKSLQEGVGGIRDVIMSGSHDVFINAYTKTAYKMQAAQTQNEFLGEVPKPLLELIGISLIAMLAFNSQASGNGGATILPLLAAFALGAQRLLPALQQIYISWTTITAAQPTLWEIISNISAFQSIEKGDETTNLLPLTQSIELRGVSFSYSGDENFVLSDVNLSIKKGEKIGIVGQTGSGKSTLVDLIMGLMPPTSGQILIDGRLLTTETVKDWRANIAHVPQSIFLSDASIAENIAFGVRNKEIDVERVKRAAEKAQIAKFIEQLPIGYQTLVGERGVRLSGGQRQRIGIARAIYKQSNVIVLDEATSALDSVTEQAVIDALESSDIAATLVMVAHRQSTLKKCKYIYSVADGEIKLTEGYEFL